MSPGTGSADRLQIEDLYTASEQVLSVFKFFQESRGALFPMSAQLDPQIATALPKLPDWDVPNLTPEKARNLLLGLARARGDLPLPQPLAIDERRIASDIPIRVYRGASGQVPTIVFLHGGGFVAGDLETHDRQARWLAVDIGAVVVSVHYRQPPEAKFPAAINDAIAATRWVAANIEELGGDLRRIGVAGDSAGGNLAACVAIACKESGPRLAAQLLVYPVTDCAGHYRDPGVNAQFPSRQQNASGYFLSTDVMQWFCDQYFADNGQAMDSLASPLRHSDLSGLAPAVVCTAQFDPLRDEGIAYANRLRQAGVPVCEHLGSGLIHGYFGMVDSVLAAGEEGRRVRGDFRALLNKGVDA
jgi:acetyl esterase